MNGSDLPTHGSMVLDIIDKHGIDFNLNFYPTTHILTYAVSATAGTDHMLTLRNLAPCFSLILPLYFFVLARFAGNAATTGRYAFVLASGFYLSSLFQPNSITTPNGLSALFLPFVAWLVLSHLKNKLAFFAALIVAMTPTMATTILITDTTTNVPTLRLPPVSTIIPVLNNSAIF